MFSDIAKLKFKSIQKVIDDAVNAAIADERISAETLALQALGIEESSFNIKRSTFK